MGVSLLPATCTTCTTGAFAHARVRLFSLGVFAEKTHNFLSHQHRLQGEKLMAYGEKVVMERVLGSSSAV
jgi:hypothetical protein